MNKDEKNQAIEELTGLLSGSSVVYLADTSSLTVEATNNFRRKCFKENVRVKVVKNTLLKKAIEKVEGKNLSGLIEVLHGPTAIMLSETGSLPAKVIKDFRKKFDKPVLKGAFVEEEIYLGDENLKALSEIKSKEELIGDIITLLQSPAKNVISALKSAENTIAGVVKTLQEKNN